MPLQVKKSDKEFVATAVSKIKTEWGGIVRQSLAQYIWSDLLREREATVKIYVPEPPGKATMRQCFCGNLYISKRLNIPVKFPPISENLCSIRELPPKELQNDCEKYVQAALDYRRILDYFHRIPVNDVSDAYGDLRHATLYTLMQYFRSYPMEISPLEKREYLAKMRYDNPDWKKYINIASTNALLRELVLMQALDLKFRYDEYKRLDDLRAILSVVSTNAASSAEARARLQLESERGQNIIYSTTPTGG